jgi:polysaccharide pyruvyl transferase WcaK-like protein
MRRIWQLILRCCHVVTVRDRSSAHALAALGRSPANRLRISNDVAFLATPAASSTEAESRVCVVSPATDPLHGVTIDPHRLVRFVAALHRSELVDQVLVVAHDIRPELDADYCQQLSDRMSVEVGIECHLAAGDIGSRLIEAYRDAAVVVTARLHGLIIAALLNKPVVYMEEVADKLRPFGDRFGFPCLASEPADERAEFERVIQRVREIDPAVLAAEVEQARHEARESFNPSPSRR